MLCKSETAKSTFKKADKGTTTVILKLDTAQKIDEGLQQLSNDKFYKRLPSLQYRRILASERASERIFIRLKLKLATQTRKRQKAILGSRCELKEE